MTLPAFGVWPPPKVAALVQADGTLINGGGVVLTSVLIANVYILTLARAFSSILVNDARLAFQVTPNSVGAQARVANYEFGGGSAFSVHMYDSAGAIVTDVDFSVGVQLLPPPA